MGRRSHSSLSLSQPPAFPGALACSACLDRGLRLRLHSNRQKGAYFSQIYATRWSTMMLEAEGNRRPLNDVKGGERPGEGGFPPKKKWGFDSFFYRRGCKNHEKEG